MTPDEQIAELRRLNYKFCTLIANRQREMKLRAEYLAGYIEERAAFRLEHPGEAVPAVLRYQIEAANNGIEAAKEDIAEWQKGLGEQRVALAAAVGEPVDVIATLSFSFVDQDGAERLCRRNKVHWVLPPAAALAIDASVALPAGSLAGLRAREAVATGEIEGPESEPVRLGDAVGFGFAD